jgi:hypothetical protein
MNKYRIGRKEEDQMNHLARIALALFDRLGADNESLKGDLLEELEKGRSSWWLWRQVIGAAMHHHQSGASLSLFAVGSALLLLLCFEAVVVTNLVVRMVLGPPFPNITAYLYLPAPEVLGSAAAPISIVWTLVGAVMVGLSLPTGHLIAQLHERHRMLALAGFGCSTMMCATITMQAGVLPQFLTMVGFVVGLVVGGRVRAESAVTTS